MAPPRVSATRGTAKTCDIGSFWNLLSESQIFTPPPTSRFHCRTPLRHDDARGDVDLYVARVHRALPSHTRRILPRR